MTMKVELLDELLKAGKYRLDNGVHLTGQVGAKLITYQSLSLPFYLIGELRRLLESFYSIPPKRG